MNISTLEWPVQVGPSRASIYVKVSVSGFPYLCRGVRHIPLTLNRVIVWCPHPAETKNVRSHARYSRFGP